MTVKQADVVDGELLEDSWSLYEAAFAELNAFAVARHLMTRNEFDQVMADPRVVKHLILDDAGVLAGLATFTNTLEAVPLIAPEYFARRWPQQYEQRRIWYIGFVAVAPHARNLGAFAEVFAEFYQIADAVDGLVAMDICTFNEDVRHLPRAIALRLSALSTGRSRAERIDQQSFWLYDMRGQTIGASA